MELTGTKSTASYNAIPDARENLFHFNRTLQSSEQPIELFELFFKEAQRITQQPCTLEICEGSSLPERTYLVPILPEDKDVSEQIIMTDPADSSVVLSQLNIYSPISSEQAELLDLYAHLVSCRYHQIRLEKANKQLSSALQEAKNRISLLNSIAHDLRTPLTSILGLSDLINNLNDPIQIHPLARDISKQAKWLHQLLENILSLVRSENHFNIHPSIEIFQDIIEQILDIYAPRLNTRRMEVILPEDPILVKVDIHLMEQVLTNVLENAIQHSPSGSRIIIELKQVKDKAILNIIDEGKGIPEENLEHLFDLYFTTRNHNKNRGTGLGLAISQSIIEKHGGVITGANREDAQGAVFTIELPALNLAN